MKFHVKIERYCVCRAAYIGALSKHRVLLTSPFTISNSSTSDSDVMFHLSVYGGLAGANSLLSLVRAFLFAYGGIEAAVVLHSRLLAAILKVTSLYFENSVKLLVFHSSN